MKRIISASFIAFFSLLGASDESFAPVVFEHSLARLSTAAEPRDVKLVSQSNDTKSGPSFKRGMVFTLKHPGGRDVRIAGDFSNWQPVRMNRGYHGVWYYFLGEYERSASVRYKFMADGIWLEDPMNAENADDNAGSRYSVAPATSSGEGKLVTYRIVKENGRKYIEFRTFNPSASYIAVAGDFNRWNPENDILIRDRNNVWRLKKLLPSGRYRYSFIVDGQWKSDIANGANASDPNGRLCSVAEIR